MCVCCTDDVLCFSTVEKKSMEKEPRSRQHVSISWSVGQAGRFSTPAIRSANNNVDSDQSKNVADSVDWSQGVFIRLPEVIAEEATARRRVST
ncbi:unnamed protein product [Heligmosomoides polygyrus]|uniref:Uncharacterized protein n=1 Tax=Heligmosomoides polygyrus TaxID=6339 RepID=A0A183FNB1_HELPZ|nr:unnamed protein product [Heligmosomoides polygyrus]